MVHKIFQTRPFAFLAKYDDGYEIKTISSNKDAKSGSNSEEGALLIQENEALIKRASMFEEEVLRFTYFSSFIFFIFSCEQLTIT